MSTTSDWLEQHVAQAKTDALTKLTQPKPTPKTPAPVVSLDPGSDTGTLGDNITADQTISIRIANPTGLTWYDANGNAAFDPGTDVAAVGGLITLTLPQTGANTLVLYQQASGQTLSAPTYFTIYVDPVANALQQAQFDQTLQTLALAYWGRALVPDEITVGRMMLDQSHGDTTALVAYLAQSPEFLQNYQGMSIPWAISDIFQNLYGRAPTAGELSTAFSLLSHGTPVTQLPALIAENPATAADRAALAAKISLAQEFTNQHDALLKTSVINNNLLSLQLLERQMLAGVHDQDTLQTAAQQLNNTLGTTTPIVEQGTSASFANSTLTLTFPFAVDWQKLDADGNGTLTIKNLADPSDGGELALNWRASGGLSLDNASLSAAAIPVPLKGTNTLSLPHINSTDADTTAPNTLTILVTGVPRLDDGTTSDVLFNVILP